MATPRTCPVCNSGALEIESLPSQISREEELRAQFVKARLGHEPEGLEAMDLTQFMHGGPARLLRCRNCGTLLRDEPQRPSYEDDAYDTALLKHLYPRYLRAFEDKERTYRGLLRDGAEVLELGSHLGAFLQTAEQWNWRPIGLDIGKSTSAFARVRGLTVRRTGLVDYSPHLRKPEALFIWNCFEQLENPKQTLRQSHRALDRHGLLVVRVPNPDFYRRERARLARSEDARELLGYNNLLGFPYLHGYTRSALERLLRQNGFEPLAEHNSSLLTPPYPDLPADLRAQWRNARQRSENPDSTAGPWIEIVSRRATRTESAQSPGPA